MIPYLVEIETAALAHGLDPDLIAGLAEQESGFNPWSWNPEPRYPYLWNVRTAKPFRRLTPDEVNSMFPPRDFPMAGGDRDQEFWAQRASWGLLQVMGAVARELGFSGPYLPALLDVPTNLSIGCRHLAAQLTWARGRYTGFSGATADRRILRSALASWNGGRDSNSPQQATLRNGPYADEVLERYDRIRSPGPHMIAPA